MKKHLSIFKYLLIFLQGVLLGMVSIGIPGFSASTIAIIIGVYVIMVDSIAGFFSNFKKSFLYLFFIYFGYGIGSMLASLSVSILFNNFPLATVIVILGVILGAIPDMAINLKPNLKKISCWIVLLVMGGAIILYNFLVQEGNTVTFPENPDVWFLFKIGITGFITSATFVIPGVDFAVVFLSLGLYYPFTNMLATLANFMAPNYAEVFLPNLKILLSYMAGYFTGVFLISKLIKFLIGKYRAQTDFASFAFIAVAPIVVIKNCVMDNKAFYYSIDQLAIGIPLAIVAFMGMLFLGIYQRQKAKREKDAFIAGVEVYLKKKRKNEINTDEIENESD